MHPRPLSAKFKGTFAYETVKERLPSLLTRALDTFRREFRHIDSSPGAETEAKQVLASMSELHYLMMTDKPLEPLRATNAHDYKDWMAAFDAEIKKNGHPHWFSSAWLFVECYLWRLIADFFLRTNVFKHYDPCETQKKESLTGNMASVRQVVHLVNNKDVSTREWLELCLWGNRCDLSLRNDTPSFSNLAHELKVLRQKILVNDTEKLLHRLDELKTCEDVTIDYVLDNAGFELFTDLCLMLHLSQRVLRPSSRIRIHVKSYPWFVSDVMRKDFLWTLDQLQQDADVREFGRTCNDLMQSGRWKLVENYFWTMPHDFAQMPTHEPQLYQTLQSSSLVVFKGDLNYRKLLGDLDWPHSTPFDVALRSFRPAFLCTLRTNKADLITGLSKDRETNLPPDFLTTGEYAVIQVSMNKAIDKQRKSS